MNGPENDKKPIESGDGGAHGSGDPAPAVDASIQGVLGRKLRENYDEVVREEVPRKFLELLEDLKRKEKKEEGR
jgi:hypothetical protein